MNIMAILDTLKSNHNNNNNDNNKKNTTINNNLIYDYNDICSLNVSLVSQIINFFSTS